MKKNILLGVHVSVAGGYFHAIEQGTEIDCTAIQVFTKSNRQWNAKPIEKEQANNFIQAQQKSNIKIVIAHASYLINLSSSTKETQDKSLAALIDEINRCHTLAIPYLVLHPGSYKKNDDLQFIGKQINYALEQTKSTQVTVLVEIMAGQGNSAGKTFEELKIIVDQINDQTRIGICFDTCHAFAAGYDFTTQDGYKKVFDHFDKIIGLSYLKAFHMNDSKKELGCHVDRHENVGEGKIPLQAFAMIMNDHRFANIPKILETPKDEGLSNDKKNMETLLNLLA
ncbi:MAG: deoxyribonuclease IV [Candidatus Chromulinivorax sp.]